MFVQIIFIVVCHPTLGPTKILKDHGSRLEHDEPFKITYGRDQHFIYGIEIEVGIQI